MITQIVIITIIVWLFLGVLSVFRFWYIDGVWDSNELVYVNILAILFAIIMGAVSLHYSLLQRKKHRYKCKHCSFYHEDIKKCRLARSASEPTAGICTCIKKSRWQVDNGVCIKCGKPFLP